MEVKSIIKTILALFLICALIVFLYFVFFPWSNEAGLNVHAKIFVNGKPVEKTNATIYQRGSDYFESLPLTAVFEGLGYSVTWDESDMALIESDDEAFFLEGHTLRDSEGATVCEIDGIPASLLEEAGPQGELFVESGELERVLSKLGISPIQIEISPKRRTVFITYEK